MKNFYFFLAFAAGVLTVIQIGLNNLLRIQIGNPIFSAFISFSVGTIGLAVLTLLTKGGFAQFSSLPSVPWHLYLGGLLGAFFVTSTIFIAGNIGATYMVLFILLGQFGGALVVDHFGWIGYPTQSITWSKMGGVLLMLLGAFVVMKK